MNNDNLLSYFLDFWTTKPNQLLIKTFDDPYDWYVYDRITRRPALINFSSSEYL